MGIAELIEQQDQTSDRPPFRVQFPKGGEIKREASGCEPRGDGVDVGCFEQRMAVAAEIIRPVLIGDNQQEIGLLGHCPYSY